MHNRTKAAIAAVTITGMAVVGTDAVTYAGTGDSLVLGKLNKSGKTTHVTSTGKGPALSLHARGKRPALAVDSKAKIVRLNADRVDGMDARGLQTRARVFTRANGTFPNGIAVFESPRVADGTYLVSYSVYMNDTWGGISASCVMIDGDGEHFANPTSSTTSTTAGNASIALSGSSVMTTRDRRWALHCSAYQDGANKEWAISAKLPVTVNYLRIDRKTAGSLALGES